MFFTGVVNAIRNFFAPKPAPKPAPRPAPRPPAPVRTAAPAPAYRPTYAAPAPRPSGGGYVNTAANVFSTAYRAVSGAARSIFGVASGNPWATAAAIAEAARRAEEAARLAREAEERRRREEARRKKQAEVDSSRGRQKTSFLQAAKTAATWFARPKTTHATSKPEQKPSDPNFKSKAEEDSWWRWYNSQSAERKKQVDEYNKTVREYEDKARKVVDNIKKPTGTGFLSSLFDKITFGGTRRAMEARTFAEQQYQKTAEINKKSYETKTKKFLDERAKKKQALESAKFSNWDEYTKAVNYYNSWQDKNVKDLEYTRAATEGSLRGYGAKSSEELTNRPGRVAAATNKFFKSNPVGQAMGGVFKYTLGGGDKNIPSLVTIPSRTVNWLGNKVDPKGVKNYYGDKTTKGIQKGDTPWTATYNQRNFNFAQPKKFTKDRYLDQVYTKLIKPTGESKESWIKRKGSKHLEKQYQDALKREKYSNYASEFLADPLFFAKPATAAAKGAKVVQKGFAAVKSSRIGTAAGSFTNKVVNSGSVKWLGAEHKTRAQVAAETVQAAKDADYAAATKFFPKIREAQAASLNKKGVDLSVFDDLKALADKGDDAAIAMLQRVKNGKLSARDRIRLYSVVGENPRATQIKQLAEKWTDFTEKMKLADNVERTRFGRAKKLYSPRVDYSGDHTLDNYNFRGFKRYTAFGSRSRTQTAKEFYTNAVDRTFRSDVELVEATKAGRAGARAKQLLDEYGEAVRPTREAAAAAAKRTKTPLGRVQKFANSYGPTSLWKKAVLKYRPAWYVNNFLYNTQAAGLAAGPGAVVDQFRLMRPKNFKKATRDMDPEVLASVSPEIGRGKLSRFANRVENISRVAAYKKLRNDGLTHKQALKRTNKYLLNYKVRRIERPIKTVVPFYSFQKGITKAAVNMPLDRPLAAKAYNQLDRHQQIEFERDFDKVVPRLKELGYTDQQIESIRATQASYFKGKLKLGDRYFNTPFNAFSEKGLSNLGINPWLAAAGESAMSVDQWGTKIKGDKNSFMDRVSTKIPQYGIGAKAVAKFLKTPAKVEHWIGKPGSEGFGMTKEAQGSDPSKPNYRKSLDPVAGLNDDILAYLGVPKSMKFDASKLLERKTMEKLKTEYFAENWAAMDHPTQEAKRAALFKKYGVTADQFYKGELSKYDSDSAKTIKKLKEEAFAKTKALYDEYGKQPHGTRGVWATTRLRELVDSGYFLSNPFLKSFDWTNPDTVGKAYKKMAYDHAKSTGDWSAYNKTYGTKGPSAKKMAYDKAKKSGNWSEYIAKYGSKYQRSEKAKARDRAVASGDWSEYASKYGVTRRVTPYQHDGKYFRSEESMKKYIEGEFWRKYSAADKIGRRQLLKDNPQYSRRTDWTDEQWDDWKKDDKAKKRQKLQTVGGFTALYIGNLNENTEKAGTFTAMQTSKKHKKVAFTTSR